MEIDGINVSYISQGERNGVQTVLILHGWGCDGTVYRGITEFLAQRFRVVIPDLPGFGKSDEPSTPFGVGDYADFVIKFCRKLELSNIIIFGHSLGGRIALKMLSDENCPLTVNRMILTGSAGIKPKRSVKSKLKMMLFKTGRVMLERFNPQKVEEYRKKHGSPDYSAASPVMRGSLVKIVNEDLKPLLCKIRQETLLIWGDADDQTPLSDGRTMERLIPDAGLAVINGAGHYAFLERPELFYSILQAYLWGNNR